MPPAPRNNENPSEKMRGSVLLGGAVRIARGRDHVGDLIGMRGSSWSIVDRDVHRPDTNARMR